MSELRRAFRRRALEVHPDRNKAANATERFQQLSAVYEYAQTQLEWVIDAPKPAPVYTPPPVYTPYEPPRASRWTANRSVANGSVGRSNGSVGNGRPTREVDYGIRMMHPSDYCEGDMCPYCGGLMARMRSS